MNNIILYSLSSYIIGSISGSLLLGKFWKIDIRKLSNQVDDLIRKIKTPIKVAVMGCEVNGPGEAKMTQIGVTGGGNDTHMIYINGKKDHRIKNEDLSTYLEDVIRKKANNQIVNR